MNKAISLTLATLAFTFSASAYSAQFSSIIDAMAMPKASPSNVSGWENVDKIKGIKWKWPYYESGAHDSTMEGTTKVGSSKNPNVGATEITITGARTFMTAIEIIIQNEGENPSKSEINKLFGPGRVLKIESSCNKNDATWGDTTYHFTSSKGQPGFIRYESSWGASGSGAVTITVANRLTDLNHRYDDYDYDYDYDYEDCYDNRILEKWAVD